MLFAALHESAYDRNAQNCFLYCLLATAVASAVGFQIDEIETEFLHAN
jgi:hypothetical protein